MGSWADPLKVRNSSARGSGGGGGPRLHCSWFGVLGFGGFGIWGDLPGVSDAPLERVWTTTFYTHLYPKQRKHPKRFPRASPTTPTGPPTQNPPSSIDLHRPFCSSPNHRQPRIFTLPVASSTGGMACWYIHIRMHIHSTYVPAYPRTSIPTYMFARIHVHRDPHIHLHTHARASIYIYMYMYMYMYMYVYMYICMSCMPPFWEGGSSAAFAQAWSSASRLAKLGLRATLPGPRA